MEKQDQDADDSGAEGEVSRGDEDIFAGHFISVAGINLNYWLFPGLIAHELAHYFFCLLAGSRVHEVVLWSPKGGHVMHTRVRGSSAILISLGPFLFNNALALLCFFDGFNALGAGDGLYGLFLLWLGFSFAVYSIPSKHDLKMSSWALRRSYVVKRRSESALARIASLVWYPIVFVVHSLTIFILTPLSVFRSLRLVWAFFLAAIVAGGGLAALTA